jgi:hypothetical protein
MNVASGMDFCVIRSVGFSAVCVRGSRARTTEDLGNWVNETPSEVWVIQQLREAIPFGDMPRFMHRDSDGIDGDEVPRFLTRSLMDDVRNSFRSPW